MRSFWVTLNGVGGDMNTDRAEAIKIIDRRLASLSDYREEEYSKGNMDKVEEIATEMTQLREKRAEYMNDICPVVRSYKS